MGVPFSTTPNNLRVPFVAAEFDNSRASGGPALLAYRILVIGQKLPGASQGANTLFKATSADQVASVCGRGSQLHRQAKALFADNTFTEAWFGVLDDATAAILATGSLAVTGPATKDGTIYLYLGGKRVTVAVANGDSASTIASNIATAIGKHAVGTILFTAGVVAGDTVTIAGTVFTAVNGAVVAGAATYDISGGVNGAATSMASQIKAHATVGKLLRASASTATVTLHAITGGATGNALTLAQTGGHATLSGATLAGATADSDTPVYADVSGSTVTLFAMNAGAVANECDVRVNYNDGEALPSGVGVAITAMNGGATNPDLTALIAAMGDRWFNVIASAYTDATSLTAMENELHSRFGPMRMIDGVMITAKSDTYSSVGTLGLSRNSPHSCIFRANASPTPPEEMAANFAGIIALSAANDPARPFQTLQSSWVKAPAETDQDTLAGSQPAPVRRHQHLQGGRRQRGADRADDHHLRDLGGRVSRHVVPLVGDDVHADVPALLVAGPRREQVPAPQAGERRHAVRCRSADRDPSIMKTEAVTWFQEMEELGSSKISASSRPIWWSSGTRRTRTGSTFCLPRTSSTSWAWSRPCSSSEL
jgi:phage tail sheath gpL-like